MESAYTESQVDKYLKRISLPTEYQCDFNTIPKLDLGFLTAVYTGQICTFPYENLLLHYSNERGVNLNPQVLYDKYLATGSSQGRGGYCLEGTVFFKHILRKIGFNVYSTGARIRLRVNGVPQGDYIGFVHTVNIVTLPDGSRYMIDVSFGGDGATKPVPLDADAITKNIGTQEIRLVRDFIPGQTKVEDKDKMWIYQYRNSTEKPWNSFYAFTETEFLDQDFEIINCFTGTSKESFQTWTMIIVKFLRRELEVYGKVMLVDGVVKRNDGGRTVVVRTCKTEEERIEALDEFFGIRLTDEEKCGIKGHVTELK